MIKRFLNGLSTKILFAETLFLLIFIPLFPKLPILDVKNTWVYIRLEDFLVFFVLLSWLALFVKKKITLKTPLTIPILIFWLIGAVATIHGVLLVFPTISNVFPNVAFLSLIRHIEYTSLFFIAYHSIENKNQLRGVIIALTVALVGVVFYGFGQKFLGFPAFLTMNEEFAKGTPIQLSELSRVPSTFAGHYDLAAYLVLIIPIFVSLFFAFRNILLRIFLLTLSLLSFVLLFMTVSRVSFIVLFISLGVVLFFQKRKLALISVPLLILLTLGVIAYQPSLLNRFKSTVSEADVVVDAKTGASLGHVKFVPKEYFKDKIVLQRRVKDRDELAMVIAGQDPNPESFSTSSAILAYKFIPEEAGLVQDVNVSTGETLPQGTGYVNLHLSPVTKRLRSFFYELSEEKISSPSADAIVFHGDFLVKRAGAYDLSFTTRTQGEWPRAIDAFKTNVLLGSGYGSVSLAVDNNYLRMLGETGLLGFLSFLILFLILGIYMRKIYPDIDSKLTKSFLLGFMAGLLGLFLNAILIDVFEASKIAFVLWMLTGVAFAILVLYKDKELNLATEVKKIATSSYAFILYLFIISIFLFSPTLENFFVGDDFTWLRWIADCQTNCSPIDRIISYFTSSDGFFFRPGTKLYFYFMYSSFWLNQFVYHIGSLLLHFAVTSLFFLFASKVLGSKYIGFIAAMLFLILSGNSEVVFWISSTGYLFNALFGLSALLLFALWDERKNKAFLILSILSIFLSVLFHEVGVVYPLLIIAYQMFRGSGREVLRSLPKRIDLIALFIPVIVYLALRIISQSHWFSGDYSYNLLLLPFNIVGNLFGYLSIGIIGTMSLPIYESLRTVLRENILAAIVLVPLVIILTGIMYRFVFLKFGNSERKIISFSILFFIIALLPFLGLGNITQRYSYLSSMGLMILSAFLISKVYSLLKSEGRLTSGIFTGIIISVFALFQIIQVQQNYFEWTAAGNNVKNFFISLEGQYRPYWSGKDAQFYFVNTPTRVGNAWVFPVGLDHAVWFAFRNNDAQIFKRENVIEASEEAGLYESRMVLEFREDGRVREIDRFEGVPLDLIIPAQIN